MSSAALGLLTGYTSAPPEVEGALRLRDSAVQRHPVSGQEEASATPGAALPTPAYPVILHAPKAPPLRALAQGEPTRQADVAISPLDANQAGAYAFDGPIFARPSTDASIRALVRRSGVLELARPARGTGCRGGQWYAVAPYGYICTRYGFHTGKGQPRPGWLSDVPEVERGLPYHYGKLVDQGAPLLGRVPSRDEWSQIEALRAQDDDSRRAWPAVVRDELRGAYFFALASEETSDSGSWLHTVRGHVLPRKAVQRLAPTRMRGEQLEGSRPVAFVTTDQAPVLAPDTLRPLGAAERYARFAIEGEHTAGGEGYIRLAGGNLIAREHVRRTHRVKRPSGVSRRDHWIHVDLSEQVLVAYDGDRPVFATLVASGVDGHATPRGLFRVRSKHVTTTMRGPDPDMGVYAVEEVPWTQYFSGDYALHGAYWHDAFGAVRSHGCVNVPPEDARWLFAWTAPELPEAWHAMRGIKGSWIYITR